jgi:hypothetical protein
MGFAGGDGRPPARVMVKRSIPNEADGPEINRPWT